MPRNKGCPCPSLPVTCDGVALQQWVVLGRIYFQRMRMPHRRISQDLNNSGLAIFSHPGKTDVWSEGVWGFLYANLTLYYFQKVRAYILIVFASVDDGFDFPNAERTSFVTSRIREMFKPYCSPQEPSFCRCFLSSP